MPVPYKLVGEVCADPAWLETRELEGGSPVSLCDMGGMFSEPDVIGVIGCEEPIVVG